MAKITVLTESQRSAISFGMRVAAERYELDSKAMRQPPMAEAHERMARQFDGQAKEVRELADLIDEADSITLDFTCSHPEIYPNGNCVDCGVLATMFPGKSSDHEVIPWPKSGSEITMVTSIGEIVDGVLVRHEAQEDTSHD